MKSIVLLVYLFVWTASLALAKAPSCELVFVDGNNDWVQKKSKLAVAGKMSDEEIKRSHRFQLSYEAEYGLHEAGLLLLDYAPLPREVEAANWQGMSVSDRLEWVQKKWSKAPENAVGSGLYLQMERAPDFLPKELILDATGNLEIVVNPPRSNYLEWESMVDWIVARYGVGSQQAMISKAKEEFLSPRDGSFVLSSEQSFEQHLGWLVFTHWFDNFEKLHRVSLYHLNRLGLASASDLGLRERGKEVFGGRAWPVAFLLHPYLSLLNHKKHRLLVEYLRGNLGNREFTQRDRDFIKESDASFKYTAGPSYRPDIAWPDRFVWEVRSAHKDVLRLKAKVLRDLKSHAFGLGGFAKFKDMKGFNSERSFEELPRSVQVMLRDLFKPRVESEYSYSPDEILSHETYRHLALPLMPFRDLFSDDLVRGSVGLLEMEFSYERAGREYGERLLGVFEKRLELGEQGVREEVMVAFLLWVRDSRVFEAFNLLGAFDVQ